MRARSLTSSAEVLTGAGGRFSFPPLPQGDYALWLEAAGHDDGFGGLRLR